MKKQKIKELRLGVGTSPTNMPFTKKGKIPVGTVFNSNADDVFSKRYSLVNEEEIEFEEEKMKDDIILEMAYNSCAKSYHQQRLSHQLIISYGYSDEYLNEGLLGATYETGKAYIQDIVKNLLSTGAIVGTGGFAGDTAVDILFAIKRTKGIYDAYNAIKESAGILSEFFDSIDKIDLSNNIEQIKQHSYQTVVHLANKNKDLIDKAGETKLYKKTKEKVSSMYKKGKEYLKEILERIKKYILVLKDKFVDFIKTSNKAIGDWIGTFIPDDFGAGSALYKGIINDIINSAMENALTIFLGIAEKIPAGMASIVFDRQKLFQFLSENLESLKVGLTDFYDTSDDGFLKSLFKHTSPAFLATKAAFKYLDLENLNVKEESKFATDLYAKVMKYMIAFFSLTEGLASGELQAAIENASSAETTSIASQDAATSYPENEVSPAPSITTDKLEKTSQPIQKDINDQTVVFESKNKYSILFLLESVEKDEEETFKEIDLEEMSVGGYALPLGTSNKSPLKSKDHHRIAEKQKEINEQRERILLLQSYHQKTTNRLK